MFQADRVLPNDVLRVCYYSVDDVKKEAEAKLPAPWIVVKDSDHSVTVGIVENKTLTIHVEIQSHLPTFVSVSEIPTFHLNKNLECLHLKTFLSDLASRQLCLGVTDSPLQEYANLPTNSDSIDKYFLHALYKFELAGYCYRTTVRSQECLLFFEDFVCKKMPRDKGTANTKTEKGRRERKATTETQRPTAHCI